MTAPCEIVKVLPGGFYASDRHVEIRTLLGSCVAACIHDHEAGVGGMNHFLLPEALGPDPVNACARYGSHAMELLINALLQLGAQRKRLEAKVFGAGQIISTMTSSDVGARNAEFVLHYLSVEHIPVLAEDMGGPWPRRLRYFPDTGQVLVKRLPPADTVELADTEAALLRRVGNPPTGGVELFS